MLRKKIKNKLRQLTLFFLVTPCFFLLLTVVVQAEFSPYTLLEPLPYMGEEKNPAPTLDTYILGMFKIGIGIAGVLAVLMITIGGVQYMTAEAISGKSEAKSRINNAIFGLILALASVLILQTLDTNLANPSLNLKDVPAPIKPDPIVTEQWSGGYTCNGVLTICQGTNQSTCEESCSPTYCPNSVDPAKINACEKTSTNPETGEEIWEGSCTTYSGTVKYQQGTSQNSCNIEQASLCSQFQPLLTKPCKKI